MKTEIISAVKGLNITGLRRRIMFILTNNGGWMSATWIHKLLGKGFRNGTIDKTYSFNRVCITLRELATYGYADKRKAKGHGNKTIYCLNLFGIKQLQRTLEKG